MRKCEHEYHLFYYVPSTCLLWHCLLLVAYCMYFVSAPGPQYAIHQHVSVVFALGVVACVALARLGFRVTCACASPVGARWNLAFSSGSSFGHVRCLDVMMTFCVLAASLLSEPH